MEFTINPKSLDSVPEEFRSDIEILLYKTTDPVSNNVTVNVADPTLENNQIYQDNAIQFECNQH